MGRDRAAYMREYRKRKADPPPDWADTTAGVAAVAAKHILALEEEIHRLKRELAARPVEPSFNSRPFRPVPK